MRASPPKNLLLRARRGYYRIGQCSPLSGPYEALVKLLSTLEAVTPPLVVDNLSIHGVLSRPETTPRCRARCLWLPQ
jgi:hypothetical protein